MPDTGTIIVVALASLMLLTVPGPAVIYILTRSVSQGRRAGLASAVGVNLGTAIHVLAAVAGLSILLASSQYAYTVVRWLGICYLIWIGVRTLTTLDSKFSEPEVEAHSLYRIFTQGVLVNVLNPKLALFFLAFLPQFIDQNAPNATTQTLVLGMTLVIIGLFSDSLYALLGGGIGDLFKKSPTAARTTRITAGFTYLALAGFAVITGSRPT